MGSVGGVVGVGVGRVCEAALVVVLGFWGRAWVWGFGVGRV